MMTDCDICGAPECSKKACAKHREKYAALSARLAALEANGELTTRIFQAMSERFAALEAMVKPLVIRVPAEAAEFEERIFALEARLPVVAPTCEPSCGQSHAEAMCSHACTLAGRPLNPAPATSEPTPPLSREQLVGPLATGSYESKQREPTPPPGNSGIQAAMPGHGSFDPKTHMGPSLVQEIAKVLNCRSRENVSNTADFLLAELMVDALNSYERTVERRGTPGEAEIREPPAKAEAAQAAEQDMPDGERCGNCGAQRLLHGKGALRCPEKSSTFAPIAEPAAPPVTIVPVDFLADTQLTKEEFQLAAARRRGTEIPPVTAKLSERPPFKTGGFLMSEADRTYDGGALSEARRGRDAWIEAERAAQAKVAGLETALDAAHLESERQAWAVREAEGTLRAQLATRDARIAGLEASAAEDSKARAVLEARCAAAEHDAGVLRERGGLRVLCGLDGE